MIEHNTSPNTVPADTQSPDDVAGLIQLLSCFAAGAAAFYGLRYLFYLDTVADWIAHTLLVLAALLLANVLLYLWLRHLVLLQGLFILLITVLLSFIVVNGLEEGLGILWLYVFPSMVFYVSTLRVGAILCSLAMVLILLILSPLGPMYTPVHNYSPSFAMLLLFTLSFVMIFSYVLDRSRRQHALRLKEMAEVFEHAAKHDALTNLYNRGEGTQRLAGEYARFQRSHQFFSVILIDIDHFKRINDTFGHDSGDQVIQEVSRRLVAGCRQMDMVARWGGEEFLLMLPSADADAAVTTAERVRQLMTRTPIRVNKRALEVTCSFGVAQIQDGDSIQALLQRADERLYQAKTTGRNRIVARRFISEPQ
ncbi:MAG: GGDEF domain-containing protein [Halomonadaceae bacterium]|nr:MAG: GGDEF domain-containing protein [Halomonadaceae bacterium]